MSDLNCLSRGGCLRGHVVGDISLTGSVPLSDLSALFTCVLRYVARTGDVDRATLASTVDQLAAAEGGIQQLQQLQRLAKALLAFSRLAVNCCLQGCQLAMDLSALGVEKVCVDRMVEIWQEQFPNFSPGGAVGGDLPQSVSPSANEDGLYEQLGSVNISREVSDSGAAESDERDSNLKLAPSADKPISKSATVQISFLPNPQLGVDCRSHVTSDLVNSNDDISDSCLVDSQCRLAVVTDSAGQSDSHGQIYMQLLLKLYLQKHSPDVSRVHTRCLQLSYEQVHSIIEQLQAELR